VLTTVSGEIWFCRPVDLCPSWLVQLQRHAQGSTGTSWRRGQGKDAAAIVESPGGSCNSSRHLGRQIVKAKMKMAPLPVLKGCPDGPRSWSGTAEHAVGASVEGFSWLLGGTWRWEEGGTAREEGLLSEMPCKMMLRSSPGKLCFFRFKQWVSEVLPELRYSVACQAGKVCRSSVSCCERLPACPSIRLRPSGGGWGASMCGGGRAAPSTYPSAAERQIAFD